MFFYVQITHHYLYSNLTFSIMIKSLLTKCALFLSLLSMLTLSQLSAQQPVFTETFNTPGTPQNASFTTNGSIGTSRWNVTRSGNDFGAKIDQGFLTLTNDVSSIANVKGWVLASTSTSNFLPAYNPILSQNAGIVSWTFNMRQLRTNPAGLTDGLYGVGYVLAGTAGSTNKLGKGYAIMLGQSGTKDPIRLVTYNNGIQTYYTKLSSSSSTLTDFGREYTSIRVEYNPLNNEWSLYLRKDNTSSFNDPKTGTLVYQGTIANAEFVNEPLTMTGAYWNAAAGSKQTAFFDNISVSVVTPEIISINPDSKTANSGAFTLTVDGKGFNTSSKVYWNGLLRTTFYVSPTQLTASIPATDLPAPGIVPITVRNGAFISNAVDFEIESSGVPVLTLSKNNLPFISTVQGTASAATDTYTISGSNLTNSAFVTAPVNFEISRDGTNYFNSIELLTTAGALTDGTVTLRARLKSTSSAGNYIGNITHTTTGALTTKVVGLTGRVLATEPTVNATLPTYTNITSTGFRLGWTNSGNGDQKIVLVRQGTAVNGVPVDATTYNANAAFSTGSLIGQDNYVVYKGSGDFVQITGLTPNTTYHISIVEFNGMIAGTENYRASGTPGNTKTLNSPVGLQVKVANTSYKIDFDNTVDGVNLDTFQGAGIAQTAEPGQLDSDSWAFTGFTSGSLDFGALTSLEDSSYENGTSDGDEVDTGIYAFNVGTGLNENYTLGIQPGGTGTSADFNPGSITLKIQNQTGAAATSFNIGYKVYVYNDQASSSKIVFSYLPAASADGSGAYTSINSVDVISPTTANLAPGWKAYYRVVTINPTTAIANNAYFYIRWSGSLVSGSGAQDEFAIDDIEVIANPTTNTVAFDGIAEDFVLQGNASLSNDLSVQNVLKFKGGKLSIKDKILTIAGTVDNDPLFPPGGLTGGATSKLVIRGTKNPTLSFDQTTPGTTNIFDSFSLIGANPNTVTIANKFFVNNILKVDEQQILDLGIIPLVGTLTSIQNNGIIRTQNTSATPFASDKTWTGSGILDMNATSAPQFLVAGTYNNLTLSSTGGTTANANVTVNGKLDLPKPNANTTQGSLSMASFTLTMGPDGTNTGIGDVTGIIKRDSFTTNKLYTFGHPNSSITFPPAGTLPTSMSAKLTIGAAPSWKGGTILRQFDIIHTGAVDTKAIIRQHYLDSELNGNVESKLVFWAHTTATPTTTFDQGRSNNNTTDNWVEISNANVGLYFKNTFDQVYITLDEGAVSDLTWNGSISETWITAGNWTPQGVPSATTKVLIPNVSNGSNRYPIIDANSSVKTITIDAGAVVNTPDSSVLTVYDGTGAWQNNGTFNPGNGTVIFNNIDATISGSTSFNNLTIATGAGLRALEGNKMSIAGTFTNSGTMFTTLLPNTIEFTGSNQIIPAVGGESFGGYYNLIVSGTGNTALAPAISTLNVRGNLTLNQAVPFTGKIINLAGISDQTIGGTAAVNFNDLIVNKEIGAVILAKDITVGGTLTLTKGNVVLGTNNLTLGSTAVAGTPFSENNMIVADAAGLVRRPFTGKGSYFFPIGERAGALAFSPITVDITEGSFENAFVEVNTKDEKHPSNFSLQNYIRHYWNVKQTGITGAIATITAKYETLDIIGSESEIAAAQLNGTFNLTSNPWIKFGPLSNNTLVATNAILTAGQTSVFTGLKAGAFSVEVYGYGDYCQNSKVLLTAMIEGGDAPFTYEWSNGLPNAETVDIPTNSEGLTNYSLTVRDANGFTAIDTNSPVNIFPESKGGTIAQADQQICAGAVPADLVLSGSIGRILYWQSSTSADFIINENNTFNTTNISNFTTTLAATEIGPVNQTTYFRAVLQNGDCAEVFSTVTKVTIAINLWDGSNWTFGEPSATNQFTSVVFGQDYNTSMGEIIACTCEVKNGATLTIGTGTSMTLQNEIVNNGGSIIVESDANLIQINDQALNIGNILVKRNLTFRSKERKEYNYFISPVEGANLKTDIYKKADGTAVIAPFVLYHQESNNKFYNSSGAYIAGRSLAVKEPAFSSDEVATAFYKGKPFNGVINYPLVYSGALLGYNLVGNPYPSNLDLNKLYVDNKTEIESTFQFWDNSVNGIYEQLGNNYTGNAYAIFNAAAGTGTGLPAPGFGQAAGGSIKTPNNIVKVGQGFMVKASGIGKELKYSNHVRLADNNGSVFYGKKLQDDRYWLKMTAPSGITSTTAIVYFANGNNQFGADDSRTLDNSDLIYSIVQNEKVGINGRTSFDPTDAIPLGTQHFGNGIYTMSLGNQEGIFANSQNIYLKDKQTNTITNLSEGDYSFSANAGDSTGRFEIIYQSDIVLVTDSKVKEGIVVYKDGEDFVIKSPAENITQVEVYDTGGRLVYKMQADQMKVIIPAQYLVQGVYILKINQKDQVTVRKIVK